MRTALLAPFAMFALVVGCTRTGASHDVTGNVEPKAHASAAAEKAQSPSTPPRASAPATPPPGAVPPPPTSGVHLALSGEGLDFVSEQGNVRHLLFDVPAAQAIDAVSRVYGAAPKRSRNEECGAGPLDMASWPDGLTVVAQHDRFVGWSASTVSAGKRKDTLATMAGVGPGSTRRELQSAYSATIQESTLGQEFAAGGLFGVLDGAAPTSRINVMWAGTSCNFR